MGTTTADLDVDQLVRESRYLWEREGVTHLLGYNEPDNEGQANLKPADAAKFWPQMQAIAAQFSPPLKLVSPAPAGWRDNGNDWLDWFFGNCTEVVAECDPSSIEYIAFHDYSGSLSTIMNRIEGASKRYGNRKIWVTEFANGGWSGTGDCRESNDYFLAEVIPALEASDFVDRYAWYAARNVGPTSNLFRDTDTKTSMELTSTGKMYAGEMVDPSQLTKNCPPSPPPAPPAPGSWVNNGKGKCEMMAWLGNAEYPPQGFRDMSFEACSQTAVARADCSTPKTIAFEGGGNGNCYCANQTCHQIDDPWLKLYKQVPPVQLLF